MTEPPGKSTLERNKPPADSAWSANASSSSRRDRSHNSKWWAISNFSQLLLWWVVAIGFYVVFDSISGRYHKGLIDLAIVSDGWYVVLASGLIGALYVKRFRLLWFVISIVLATLILLLMLLGLGALKNLMNP